MTKTPFPCPECPSSYIFERSDRDDGTDYKAILDTAIARWEDETEYQQVL